MTLTYVDASVLIASVRGQGELPARVLAMLDARWAEDLPAIAEAALHEASTYGVPGAAVR